MNKKATILLVDDEIDLLESIADLLIYSGYEVLTARSGSEGLAVMAAHTPDIIISDVMMQPMDGFEFFGAIRKKPEWFSIPFVFISAHDLHAEAHAAAELGPNHYLRKPFNPDDLLEVVQGHLKQIRGL